MQSMILGLQGPGPLPGQRDAFFLRVDLFGPTLHPLPNAKTSGAPGGLLGRVLETRQASEVAA